MNDKLKNIIVIVTFITIIFGMLFLNIIKKLHSFYINFSCTKRNILN